MKACIAKGTQRYEFPDKGKVVSSYSHNLRELTKVAGLEDERVEQARQDRLFHQNWEAVQSWSAQDRYRRHLPEKAQELLEAVGDKHHGVISWIKLHW